MFDNFRYLPSKPYYICCEESPTNGIYDHCQSNDHDLHARIQVSLNVEYFFNLQYLGQSLSYCIRTWHDGRRMHGLDLDLDRDFENVWKVCSPCFFIALRDMPLRNGACDWEIDGPLPESIGELRRSHLSSDPISCALRHSFVFGRIPPTEKKTCRSNAWRKASVSRTMDWLIDCFKSSKP